MYVECIRDGATDTLNKEVDVLEAGNIGAYQVESKVIRKSAVILQSAILM